MRWKRFAFAAAGGLALLAVLGGYLFQTRPVFQFQPGRDSAALHAGVSSTTGKLRLVIHGTGKYTVTSLKVTVNEYFVYAPLPTTFALEPSENVPVIFALPANWTISVSGPSSSGQAVTVVLEGTWWTDNVLPVPITSIATTRILWI